MNKMLINNTFIFKTKLPIIIEMGIEIISHLKILSKLKLFFLSIKLIKLRP